jgi:hypothetical protein
MLIARANIYIVVFTLIVLLAIRCLILESLLVVSSRTEVLAGKQITVITPVICSQSIV